jgi:hypothetical protein
MGGGAAAAPLNRATVEEVVEPGQELAALVELPEAEAGRWRATLEADAAALAGAGVRGALSDVYLAGQPVRGGGAGGSSLLGSLVGADAVGGGAR